jgi:hypothetical protein
MQPDAIARDIFQRPIDRIDVHVDLFGKFFVGQS